MTKHKCIKPICVNFYESNEEEAYYCPTCIEEKRSISDDIDKRIGSTVGQVPSSELTQFDALPKTRGFVNIKDLGISL